MNSKSFLLACLLLILIVPSCARPKREEEMEHADQHIESEHADDNQHLDDAGSVELDREAIEQAGIKVAAVQGSLVPDYVVATGVVSHNQSLLSHVRPLSEGVVRGVFVQPGDRVRKGQRLVSYDNIEVGDLAGDYQERQAELRAALADREVKQKLWERGRELYQHQAISQVELELREAALAQAEEAVRKWESAIAQTKVKLLRFGIEPGRIEQLAGSSDDALIPEDLTMTLLRAPFDGVVIDFDVSPGELAAPQRVLLSVANLTTVWILADVYEKDLGKVVGAQSAVIELEAYPERTFEGRITYFGDVLDPETRTLKVRCVVRNPDYLLKLGMFATVRIPTRRSRELPVIPPEAVQMVDGNPVVFVKVGDGRFERRRIQTGREAEGMIVVEEGLEIGETIATTGSFSLKSELLREQLGGGHGH